MLKGLPHSVLHVCALSLSPVYRFPVRHLQEQAEAMHFLTQLAPCKAITDIRAWPATAKCRFGYKKLDPVGRSLYGTGRD